MSENDVTGRLSHYEILEEIGRGGMGVVYRARDTELRRDVAVKVLPEAFVSDRERLSRFEREARVLAALNHPGIATIHELGRDGATHFLVMELVPGEDLAARLSRGAMTLDEVLTIFPKIAEALEAAHGQGVVHRDLKPANVKVTPEGRVKLLDFGLAKPVETSAEQDPSLSPTLTREGTAAGVILGTASYMSPEQALGKTVDKRADVWAFGCVLYEALSGKKAFPGTTVVETLASVLRREPDWNALPEDLPVALRILLRRCLRTDPERRLHDIADARIDIEEATSPLQIVTPEGSKRVGWAWLAAALAAGLLAGFVMRCLDGSPAPPVLRLSIVAPEGTELPRADIPAVSPDGREVAFVARDPSGGNHVWIRTLDSFTSRKVPGTEGATYPFWSPDGEKLGFFAKGKLRATDRNGGGLLELADVENARGGTWSSEGIILFAPGRGTQLFRVSAQGGPVLPVTEQRATDESHRSPQFLPDGRRFIYRCTCGERSGVYVGSLDAGELHKVGRWPRAQFVPPGYLVFVSQEGWLMAQRFDPGAGRLEETPVPLREDPDRYWDAGWFSVSDNGVLVYIRDELFTPDRRLVWYDRAGRELGSLGMPGAYASPELSPDDRFVAFGWSDPASGAAPDIWIHDSAKDAPFRLLARDGTDRAAVWSPDGSEIVFQGNSGAQGLYRKRVGSEEEPELLVAGDAITIASSWAHRWLVYFRRGEDPTRALDIWALPLSPSSDGSPGQPRPLVETDGAEGNAQISPDGGWMAYQSTLGGAGYEIYVQRFPEDTERIRVSQSRGMQPRWRGDGKELFFLEPTGALMAVEVELGREFRHGEPRRLFQTPIDTDTFTMMRNHYDVTSDGERVLVVKRSEDAAILEIHVVMNWTSLLRD